MNSNTQSFIVNTNNNNNNSNEIAEDFTRNFLSPQNVVILTILLSIFKNRRKLVLTTALSFYFVNVASNYTGFPSLLQRSLVYGTYLGKKFPRNVDFNNPKRKIEIPLILQWIDGISFVPSRWKSFPGLKNEVQCFNLSASKKKQQDGGNNNNSNLQIGIWLIKPNIKLKTNESRKCILYHHTRSSNRANRKSVRLYDKLVSELGVYVCTFDGRESHSTFNFTERSSLEDSFRVWSFLVESPQKGGLGFDSDNIILWGEGLGAARACNLSLYLIQRGSPPLSLVLECPFTSYTDYFATKVKGWILWKQFYNAFKSMLRDFLKGNRFDLESRIKEIALANALSLLILSAETSTHNHHSQRLADIACAIAADESVSFHSFKKDDEIVGERDILANHAQFIPVLKKFFSKSSINLPMLRSRSGSSIMLTLDESGENLEQKSRQHDDDGAVSFLLL